jgi:hypothetical protein
MRSLRLVILHQQPFEEFAAHALLFIIKDCPLDMQLLSSSESVVVQGIY